MVTPPAVGVPGTPAKAYVAKAVFWKAPRADPQLCAEEGQVWTRPQGRQSARTIGHFRGWQQEPPEISFKGHSSGNLRMAPGSQKGGEVTLTTQILPHPGFSISSQLTWASTALDVTPIMKGHSRWLTRSPTPDPVTLVNIGDAI